MGTWWSKRDGHDQKQCSGRLWYFNNAQLVLRGPKCANKTSPTPLLHHQQPVQWIQGIMYPCLHAVNTKFWLHHLSVSMEIDTHQTRQHFSSLYWIILVSQCKLYPHTSHVRTWYGNAWKSLRIIGFWNTQTGLYLTNNHASQSHLCNLSSLFCFLIWNSADCLSHD